MPMLGRSLLYVRSHCVAKSWASSMLSMGIAKLFTPACEGFVGAGSCYHLGGVVDPEGEGIGAGMAV